MGRAVRSRNLSSREDLCGGGHPSQPSPVKQQTLASSDLGLSHRVSPRQSGKLWQVMIISLFEKLTEFSCELKRLYS